MVLVDRYISLSAFFSCNCLFRTNIKPSPKTKMKLRQTKVLPHIKVSETLLLCSSKTTFRFPGWRPTLWCWMDFFFLICNCWSLNILKYHYHTILPVTISVLLLFCFYCLKHPTIFEFSLVYFALHTFSLIYKDATRFCHCPLYIPAHLCPAPRSSFGNPLKERERETERETETEWDRANMKGSYWQLFLCGWLQPN